MFDNITFTSLTGRSTATPSKILMVAAGAAITVAAATKIAPEFKERKDNPVYKHKQEVAERKELRRQQKRGMV